MGKTIIIKGQEFDFDHGSKRGVFRALRVMREDSFIFESETYLFLPGCENLVIENVSYIHTIKRVGSPDVSDKRDLDTVEARELIAVVDQQLIGNLENTSSD